MATLETSPEANSDRQTKDRRTEKPPSGARATALPKKDNFRSEDNPKG